MYIWCVYKHGWITWSYSHVCVHTSYVHPISNESYMHINIPIHVYIYIDAEKKSCQWAVHTCIHTHVHSCKYTHTCVYLYGRGEEIMSMSCAYMRTNTCIFMWIYPYMCVCMQTWRRNHVHGLPILSSVKFSFPKRNWRVGSQGPCCPFWYERTQHTRQHAPTHAHAQTHACAHTKPRAHTDTYTHTHTNPLATTHTSTYTLALSLSLTHTHIHTYTQIGAHTHKLSLTHTNKLTRKHARTH